MATKHHIPDEKEALISGLVAEYRSLLLLQREHTATRYMSHSGACRERQAFWCRVDNEHGRSIGDAVHSVTHQVFARSPT